MKTITVGQLRQNPTQMLAEVEAGETYAITKHGREVGRVVPPADLPEIIPAKKKGQPSELASRPRPSRRTYEEIEEAIAWVRSDRV